MHLCRSPAGADFDWHAGLLFFCAEEKNACPLPQPLLIIGVLHLSARSFLFYLSFKNFGRPFLSFWVVSAMVLIVLVARFFFGYGPGVYGFHFSIACFPLFSLLLGYPPGALFPAGTHNSFIGVDLILVGGARTPPLFRGLVWDCPSQN